MTDSNHRTGTRDILSNDYVIKMYAAKGLNDNDVGPELQEFLRLGFKHGPENVGSARVSELLTSLLRELIEGVANMRNAYTVFYDKERAETFIKNIVKTDLGISVVVSGLFDEVDRMREAADIKHPTAQRSVEIRGKVGRLPQAELLDITAMCGHGLVSFDMAHRMATDVSSGQISLEQAAGKMAKTCVCGIFDPKHAEDLLTQYIATNFGKQR